mgnify:CR=1 FL=1
MHWINIHTETLRGKEFVGAEPIERATWLSLLGWCCAQENSGRIESCSDWTSRKWQQLCGITLEEVQIKSELYVFDGLDLVVHFYPMDNQESVAAKRKNGKKGGRPKKTAASETITQQDIKPRGSVLVNHVANLDITLKERKEKKRKGNTTLQIRIGNLVKRRESTKWNDKENTAFRKLNPTEEDIAFLESKKYADHPYRRRDLITLLNNWGGELDRMNTLDSHPSHHQSQNVTPIKYGI